MLISQCLSPGVPVSSVWRGGPACAGPVERSIRKTANKLRCNMTLPFFHLDTESGAVDFRLIVFERFVIVPVKVIDQSGFDNVVPRFQVRNPRKNSLFSGSYIGFVRSLSIGLCGGNCIGALLVLFQEFPVIRTIPV